MEWDSTEHTIMAFVNSHPEIKNFQAYPLNGKIISWMDDIESWRIPAKNWAKKLEEQSSIEDF